MSGLVGAVAASRRRTAAAAAAPAYVQKQDSNTTSPTTPYSPSMPPGFTVGNLLVCSCFTTDSSGSFVSSMTPSAGWTTVINGTAGFGPSAGYRLFVFAKIAAASQTLTLTPSSSAYFAVVVEEFSGVNAATPFNGTASGGTADTDMSVNTPGITTTVNNTLVLYFYADLESGTTIVTPPAGTTTRRSGLQFLGHHVLSDIVQATAGAVAATNHTRTTQNNSALAAVAAIRS